MSLIGLGMLIVGFALATIGAAGTDYIDAKSGRRPGGYGSNKSFTWPWGPMAAVGMSMVVVSMFVIALSK
jgi:hypothetical protein